MAVKTGDGPVRQLGGACSFAELHSILRRSPGRRANHSAASMQAST